MRLSSAFSLEPGSLDDLPLAEALAVELATPPDLLPGRVVEQVLNGREADYIRRLKGLLKTGLVVEQPEVMAARKSRGGSRPVPVLTIHERVVLRALAMHISGQLSPDLSKTSTYEEMVEGPIEAGSDWVVHGDVASFYSFVDHDALTAEIVGLTGDALAAEALADLLERIMGRRFGLPQGYRASDAFGESYVDVVERNLIRRGRSVWRYNDDFRIDAVSWPDAQGAIEELDEELRRVGLALNDDKTFVQTGEAYGEWVHRAENLISELAEELQTDLTGWNPYTDEEVEPDEEAIWVGAALGALEGWLDRRHIAGPMRLANRRLLSTALSILRTFTRTDGLSFCRDILATEPQLTPQVASYIEATILSGDPARAALRKIVTDEELYLNDWQNLWLLEPLKSSAKLPKTLRDWATRCYTSRSMAVAASAAALLSSHRLATVGELLDIYGRARTANRPAVVSALGLRAAELSKPQRKAVQEDFLLRWVFEAAAQTEEPF